MTRVIRSDTGRAATYAALGFALVLLLGSWASREFSNGDSFAGLGIAAATVKVLAPLGGLAGALVAARHHRRIELTPVDRETLASAMIATWVLTIILLGLTNAASAVTALIFATTGVVILRVALVEGAFRHNRRGRGQGGPRSLHLRARR